MTERVRRVRRKKVKRRSKRIGRVMLSSGMTGVALAPVLAGVGFVLENPRVIWIAVGYLLCALLVLSIRQVMERMHQIRKRKYTHR